MIALLLSACLIIVVFGSTMTAIYVWVAFLLAVCGYFFYRAYSLTWIPVQVHVPAKVPPPAPQWRWHDSNALYHCTSCGNASREGWWSPWTFDEVEGWHSNADDHYCTNCMNKTGEKG